jgi:hypothetical protein
MEGLQQCGFLATSPDTTMQLQSLVAGYGTDG